ncbi:hypothetical protein GCM10025858_00740 [Alicyclobacillus sacchari]|nr:hypothetical protein GCM10025858_00740 [Alicyclobacillus sacchari]
MEANLLRRLYAHTREWGRAQRGIDLLRLAAEALQALGQIDTGCFIYRKRGIETDFVPQPAEAFAPWGRFRMTPALSVDFDHSSKRALHLTFLRSVGFWRRTYPIYHWSSLYVVTGCWSLVYGPSIRAKKFVAP